jgi:sporulation protein YlmC with PRC-barrel domain
VNDKNEKLGTVEDLIVNPEKSLSYAIVGVGGYLGGGKRDVAIPTNQLKIENDKLVLAGASKDVVRAMPEFRYMK